MPAARDEPEDEAPEPKPRPKPRARKRRRTAAVKPLDHEVPAIIEPITRSPQAGALALAAAAWLGSLVPSMPQHWRDEMMAAGGLLGVIALGLQRIASIRADARKAAMERAEKGEDNDDADGDQERA
jgi:hypothetical protein